MNNANNENFEENKNQIRLALQTADVRKLMLMVPELDEKRANLYIKLWKNNYEELMKRMRYGQDTAPISRVAASMLHELLEMTNYENMKNNKIK